VEDGVTALVVESSSDALTYWTTRPFPIVKTLLRTGPHGQSMNCQEMCTRASNGARRKAIAEELLLPPQHAEPDAEVKSKKSKKKKKKGRSEPASIFTVESIPPIELECLYGDRIFRDTKGRPTASASFRGSPYRYDITGSTHVIYPTGKAFVSLVQSAHLVVAHSKVTLAWLKTLGRTPAEPVSQSLSPEASPEASPVASPVIVLPSPRQSIGRISSVECVLEMFETSADKDTITTTSEYPAGDRPFHHHRQGSLDIDDSVSEVQFLRLRANTWT